MTLTEREGQLMQWVSAAPESEALEYENEVMWGVVFNLDSLDAPVALFGTEEEAKAYAMLCHKAEWHVGPYVATLRGRNSVDIPVPEPAKSP